MWTITGNRRPRKEFEERGVRRTRPRRYGSSRGKTCLPARPTRLRSFGFIDRGPLQHLLVGSRLKHARCPRTPLRRWLLSKLNALLSPSREAVSALSWGQRGQFVIIIAIRNAPSLEGNT
ncbi:uncharacterized protein [Apteryx mantelli]|uniref:Uncharacterized protein isoform X2 n=1 Tax=Apteryx mantelli TaxID=2696672 RepID=A0ABM4EQT1_9AVES